MKTARQEQKPGEVSLNLGYCNSELTGTPLYLPERRNIIGSVDSARRGALVRHVAPRNWPRALRRSASVIGATGRRSATSAPREHQPRNALAWGERRLHNLSLKKDSWAELRRFLKECCGAHCPDASDREHCASAEKTPVEGASVARAAITREPERTWTTGGRRERL